MSDLPDPVANGSNPLVSSQNSGAPSVPQSNTPVPPAATPISIPKEIEPAPTKEQLIEEIKTEIEVTPELEKIGVEKKSERITVPVEVQKMGVEAVGSAQPVIEQTIPGPHLPLSDEKIEQGLHTKIWSSFRWFAQWCVKQLKRAHYHLKVISGRVVREADR